MAGFFALSKNVIQKIDKLLWLIIAIVSFYGLLLNISAARASGGFCKSQLIAVFLGIVLAFLIQFVDYRKIAKHYFSIGCICVALFIFTLIFGTNITGISGVNARAWVKLPFGMSFQPSELIKIGFIVTIAKHLEILNNLSEKRVRNRKLSPKMKCLILLAFHVFVPILFTHLQGDDGAAIIFLCIAVFEMFIDGIESKYFLWAITAFAISAPLMWNFALAPYQKNRILNQFNPESDPLGVGFQQIQGKISIGSGGIFGKGLFCGKRVGDGSVPIQESDFIFSVSGEELGFAGCFLILILMIFLILRISFVARRARDQLGVNICFGFIGLIASQCIFNIGMCLSLIPVIGVTLPFFSAGGSSVICLFICFGIIQSIRVYS
ncbi:MAG: FtsW/RodA/SpoVE family cell cycle protein [Oscillospiraceae bacterium]|jgi:rod shape determining protein RodA|nr:FtsW/RodA/SpoVE family cell cycle protein [Oscillospiraceae bacterium]